MRSLFAIKTICCLNIIIAFLIIFLLHVRSRNHIPSSIVSFSKSHSIKTGFRKELIGQFLKSHYQKYMKSSRGCNITKPLNNQQNDTFFAISKLLVTLRQQLVSYPKDYFSGRAIVLTVGLDQLRFAKINLKMMGLSHTQLPIQIWYSSIEISEEEMMELFDAALTLNLSICCFHRSQCRNRRKTWHLNRSHVYKPVIKDLNKQFPYKPAAILSSTFAEVLFLDCDAYVTRDPEEFFLSDPMYLKFGALFHADAHQSRQHPSIWALLNTSCAMEEYELDSASILVDKKRVWNGLYMTKLINDYHQSFYGRVTDGDKDTFRLAFRYMNIAYYIVAIPCSTGTFDGTYFCGLTLCKSDSLGQHIYINHIHIFKYENIPYTRTNLEYTRIALGDSNTNSFVFKHCRFIGAFTSCFQILNNSNSNIGDQCLPKKIRSDEIENYAYMLNQPLLYEKSRINRVFLSKTSYLMPKFVDNLLRYLN